MNKNINVNIANVISWFQESEQCMLHNHAERIPNSLDNKGYTMNELQLQVKALTDKFSPNYYKSVEVDEGWYQIVVDCDKELTAIDPEYSIYQIKEKFGGLRYYYSTSLPNASDAMDKVISKYEAIAAVTCEATGKPGVLMKSKGSWYRTLDPEYAKSTLFFKDYSIVDRG